MNELMTTQPTIYLGLMINCFCIDKVEEDGSKVIRISRVEMHDSNNKYCNKYVAKIPAYVETNFSTI